MVLVFLLCWCGWKHPAASYGLRQPRPYNGSIQLCLEPRGPQRRGSCPVPWLSQSLSASTCCLRWDTLQWLSPHPSRQLPLHSPWLAVLLTGICQTQDYAGEPWGTWLRRWGCCMTRQAPPRPRVMLVKLMESRDNYGGCRSHGQVASTSSVRTGVGGIIHLANAEVGKARWQGRNEQRVCFRAAKKNTKSLTTIHSLCSRTSPDPHSEPSYSPFTFRAQ